ncbi:poly(a) RNA polymerase [Anaeramoeba flamelloides]|uniref:Poly(A) RNA polymerase n=1 Tax=Anaeramoeba flamelloides TaxID=1746091 RepID=A0AAV7Z2F6_9EUKA|nr:poly(a) RNA polymerase [Anaeramoeba flamelloides]
MSETSPNENVISEKEKKGQELFELLLARHQKKKKKKKKNENESQYPLKKTDLNQNNKVSNENKINSTESLKLEQNQATVRSNSNETNLDLTNSNNQEQEQEKRNQNNSINENKNESNNFNSNSSYGNNLNSVNINFNDNDTINNDDNGLIFPLEFDGLFFDDKEDIEYQLKETQEESDDLLSSNQFLSKKLREMGNKIELLEEYEEKTRVDTEELTKHLSNTYTILKKKNSELEKKQDYYKKRETRLFDLISELGTLREEKQRIVHSSNRREEELKYQIDEQSIILGEYQKQLTTNTSDKEKKRDEQLIKIIKNKEETYETQLKLFKSENEIEFFSTLEKIKQLEETRELLLSEIEKIRNNVTLKTHESLRKLKLDFQKNLEEKQEIIKTLRSGKVQIQTIIQELGNDCRQAKQRDTEIQTELINEKNIQEKTTQQLNDKLEDQIKITNNLNDQIYELQFQLDHLLKNQTNNNNDNDNDNNNNSQNQSKLNHNQTIQPLLIESLKVQAKNTIIKMQIERLNRDIETKKVQLQQQQQKIVEHTSETNSYKKDISSLKKENDNLLKKLNEKKNSSAKIEKLLIQQQTKNKELEQNNQTMQHFFESQTNRIEKLTNLEHYLKNINKNKKQNNQNNTNVGEQNNNVKNTDN